MPPLDYPQVLRLKREFPDLNIVINGGITDLQAGSDMLQGVDGVMIGRQDYESPFFMAELQAVLMDDQAEPLLDRTAYLESFLPFLEKELAQGTPLYRFSGTQVSPIFLTCE